MKNALKYIASVQAVFIALCMALSSCGDWTDTESLKLNEPDFSKDNPKQYAKYLEELRAYKNSDHKILYSWFENLGVPASRGHHINAVPDSVDIISLMNPDNLPEWVLGEMEEVRKNKGTKVIYTISYFTIEALYNDYMNELGDNGGEEPEGDPFLQIAAKYMDETLALCDKYGYDGLAVHYMGKATNHMEEDVKEQFLARQEAFMSKTRQWVESHPKKLFVFEGTPHFVADKSILESAEYIVLRTNQAKTASTLDYDVLTALGEPGVPNDRIIVMADTYSLDPTDTSTGTFIDADGNVSSAVKEMAYWVATPDAAFTKAGLGVHNIRNDYYNLNKVYQYTREAIEIMNPSPKR